MRLQVVALVLVALAVAPSSAEAACPTADSFRLQVERPDRAAARGVSLVVVLGHQIGAPRLTVLTTDSGDAQICHHGAREGEMVDLFPVAKDDRVLYPSRGRVPLSREGSAVVVCDARRDCNLTTNSDVIALIQKAQPRTQSMTASEKEAFFRDWADYATQLSRDMNAENAKLLAALVRKGQQVAAASRASTLVGRFANQAREVLVRFERHAERVLVQRDRTARARELKEMNKAYLAYNPVFDELRERSDAYLKDTSDYWSPEVSAALRALFHEALQLHRAGIYPLNSMSMLINDCVRKLPACPDPQVALTTVQGAAKTVREVTLPRLDHFETRSKEWLTSLDEQLYSESAAASPPARQ